MSSPLEAFVVSGPQWFKRAQRGLFAGKQRLSGNHVSPSKRHVRRTWLPNVQRKKLWSDILGKQISVNVTTAALRQIDRVGGLDNYVLSTKDADLASQFGSDMKRELVAKMLEKGVPAEAIKVQAGGEVRVSLASAKTELQ